jgi:hypothetical protein
MDSDEQCQSFQTVWKLLLCNKLQASKFNRGAIHTQHRVGCMLDRLWADNAKWKNCGSSQQNSGDGMIRPALVLVPQRAYGVNWGSFGRSSALSKIIEIPPVSILNSHEKKVKRRNTSLELLLTRLAFWTVRSSRARNVAQANIPCGSEAHLH